ncbi:hypothetical protein [Aquitalea pelogenes]|uniref:hypothetical protein n=1 Tax=Aquitalea pelogenes TaxID=1293573 RepID=UPI0035B37929
MQNLEVSLRLSLNGQTQIVSGLRRAEAAMRSFGTGAERALYNTVSLARKLNHEINGFSAMSRLAATLGGLSAARDAMRDNLRFHRDLLEMKQTGEMTTAQSNQAKQKALDVASSTLQMPEDVLSGLRAFTSAGEKFEFAIASISESSRAATAYFTSAETVAKLDVDARQKLGIQPEQQASMHNMLLYHGRAGRYEVGAMAQDAPKTFNTMAAAGFTGIEAVNLTGAITQQLMKLAPATQPSEVATFMEHFFGHLTQKHYVKGLKDKGIDIKKYMPGGYFGGVDKQGKPIGGQKAVDSLFAFLRELKAKNLDDPFKLSEAGFREMYTSKAARQLLGNVDVLENEMQQGEDAARNDLVGAAVAEIREASFGKIKAAEVEVAKLKLSDKATQATGGMAGMVKWAAENPLTAAGSAAALLVGGHWTWKRQLPRLLGKMEAREAARLEKATQARPTLRTNTAGQITNHAEIKAWEQAQATAARESRLAKTGKLIGKAGGVVLGGVLAANEALDINKDPTLSDQQKKIAWSGLAGDVAGGTIGGWGGAAMGAALGTAILPGIGTAIGGLLGAIGGAISGGWLGNKAGTAAGTAWFSDPSGSSSLAGNGGNSLQPQPPLALLQSVMDSSTRFNLAADKMQQASQQPMVVQLQGEFRLNGNDLVAVVNQNNSLTARRN